MSEPKLPNVVNVDEAPEESHFDGERWGHAWKVLTPSMAYPGNVGVSHNRLPPGRAAVPFHTHQLDDEVFFVLSGRGVLRYGDQLQELRAGDCVACPAGKGIAHQIANPYDEDLVYLAFGGNSPNEVCTYPDTGKVMIRALKQVGRLEQTPYMEGEPDVPAIFELVDGD